MGIYSDEGKVNTGPVRPIEKYGTDKQKIYWAMLSSDRNARMTNKDTASYDMMYMLTSRRYRSKHPKKPLSIKERMDIIKLMTQY